MNMTKPCQIPIWLTAQKEHRPQALTLANYRLFSKFHLLLFSEGHLNFRALRDLGRKEMVVGMPVVEHVEQVCDGCTLGKQHRTPFPQASNSRAESGLELVHADLCGQISPMTPGGCSYFLT